MPKASIVMFSGDLDKALASFIIANGAAAAGWDVTIFFTFWGINLLRDPAKYASKSKTAIEKMMGMMMANGPDAPKISKMNMLGMGTSMIKGRMKGLRVQSLKDMMKDAKELGVKFLICDLSMGIMGLQKEEFSDIVDDYVGVGTYISESENANITLFI